MPIPPFHSRSTGARSTALTSSSGVSGASSRPSTRRASGDRSTDFALRGVHAAARRQHRGVVVGPRRRRAASNSRRRSANDAAGSGSGSTNTWRWSNAATSCTCGDRRRPLPNTSPDMSPMPTTVSARGVGVDVERAEVRLHRHPRAARRDAHLLVVEAGGPARRERVAEPVAVLGRERVGDVGERAGALVGRDHEVGVVAVAPHHAGRRHDRARPSSVGDAVVGELEQPADERLVRTSSSRRASRRTRPWRPTGTITAFFTVCAFISPRTSVRKSSRRSDQRMPPRAMSPARRCTPSTDGDATQISCCGVRPGQEVERGRIELAREVRLAAVRVGAHGGAHHLPERAQDAVGVEADDRVDGAAELLVEPRDLGRVVTRRVRDRAGRGTARRAGAPPRGSRAACRRGMRR